MPKVSVIIPNYNHAAFLAQRIDSVLNQTYTDFELIILDDCSADSSSAVIAEYRSHPKLAHLHFNKKNSGSPFAQWIKGIELAAGEYIWIAESDDWCEPHFLEKMMVYAERFPTTSLLYSDTILVEDQVAATWKPRLKDDFQFFADRQLLKQKLFNALQINNASAVVFKRNEALKHLTGLAQYKKHGDYFFWIQLATEGDGVFINAPLNYCRILPTSVTRQALYKNKLSLLEHLEIFRLLCNYLPILTSKEKLHFFDCWAIMFGKMLGIFSIRERYDFYLNTLPASNYSIRFFYKVIFFTVKLKLQIRQRLKWIAPRLHPGNSVSPTL